MALTGAERLILDGVDLKTFAKNTPSLGGNLATPGRRGSNVPTAGRSGALWTPDKPFEEGSFPLSFWVRGCDDDGRIPSGSSARREFMARVDELVALFTRGNGLSTLGHVLPDGSYREIQVECVDAINWAVSGPSPLGKVDFQLKAPGAFWQGPQQSAGMAPANATTIFSGATAPLEDATYLIQGPITNPRITDAVGNAVFLYGGALSSSQSLTLNAATWSLSSTGSASTALSLVSLSGTGGRLMRLLPDNVSRGYRVQLTGTQTTSATRLTVTGRAKYLNG